MDTLLLFQTTLGQVEIDVSMIFGHIRVARVGADHLDFARVYVPQPLNEPVVSLTFATNEEAAAAFERIHAARVAYRASQVNPQIDAPALARALVTEVMGDGNSRLRWAMITSAANEAMRAGARELVACLMPEPVTSLRWALIKSALSEAAKAGAREYAGERNR